MNIPTEPASDNITPYEKEGGREYHEAIHGGLESLGYSLVAEFRASKLQPYISPTDNVLEYGIGPGWNLAKINAGSRRGLDVSIVLKSMVESQGIEFISQIRENDKGFYDIIICSHVLEHVSNPSIVLETILKCLNDGGKALLYVPYDFEAKFKKYRPSEPNHHLYCWNVQTFSNLLLSCGFRILEGRLQKFGYERIIARWVEKLRLPKWTYPLLLRIALFIKPSYELAFVATKRI